MVHVVGAGGMPRPSPMYVIDHRSAAWQGALIGLKRQTALCRMSTPIRIREAFSPSADLRGEISTEIDVATPLPQQERAPRHHHLATAPDRAVDPGATHPAARPGSVGA